MSLFFAGSVANYFNSSDDSSKFFKWFDIFILGTKKKFFFNCLFLVLHYDCFLNGCSFKADS